MITGLRRLLGFTALALSIAPAAGVAQTSGELHFGNRSINQNSSLLVAEARIAIQVGDWRLRPEVGLSGAANTGDGQWNVLAGVRFDPTSALSLGAGLDVISDEATDRVLGGYVTGALQWLFNDSEGFGLNFRASFAPDAERTLDGLPQDVDYQQWSVFFRFGL